MSALITAEGVSFRTPDGRTLFENLTLAFGRERTGLIGRNGVGKTTLLRLLAGEAEPTSGTVSRRGRIGVLRQALAPAAYASVADELGAAEALARLDRIERGTADAADLDAADWTLPTRLEQALGAVGLSGLDLARPVSILSGGQATRLALARLLVEASDMILLDEPTNNLDAEARDMLGDILAGWRGGAVVVSHDRELLRGVDRIVELTTLGAQVYGGGYDLYLARKADEDAAVHRQLHVAERDAARIDRAAQTASERKARKDSAGRRSRERGDAPKMFLDARQERAETTGGRASRLADRQRAEAAQALGAAQGRMERVRRLAFDLPPTGLPAGKGVLSFEDAGFAWPGRPAILAGQSLRIVGPGRIAVVGPNGSGKTTLLRLASGDLKPTAGSVERRAPSIMLDQRTAILADDQTLTENFQRLNPGTSPHQAHVALARFLFRGQAALKTAGELSGGERLRAALACVLNAEPPPPLLILDEPTNHLDLDSIQAVEQALAGYDGALLICSHDEDFLTAVGIERRIKLVL